MPVKSDISLNAGLKGDSPSPCAQSRPKWRLLSSYNRRIIAQDRWAEYMKTSSSHCSCYVYISTWVRGVAKNYSFSIFLIFSLSYLISSFCRVTMPCCLLCRRCSFHFFMQGHRCSEGLNTRSADYNQQKKSCTRGCNQRFACAVVIRVANMSPFFDIVSKNHFACFELVHIYAEAFFSSIHCIDSYSISRAMQTKRPFSRSSYCF